jgi:predicted amidohydrolase YtcJ
MPSAAEGPDPTAPADLLFTGGLVRRAYGPATPAAPTTAHALAVRDGRVVAFDEAALASRGRDTTEVDLAGGVLLPSFGDGHVHPLWGGVELGEAPIRDCTSVEEIVAVVRRWAAEHPDLTWITGGSYDPSLAPHGLFDARWLDAAVPDRPVYLEASDHHCAWVNTEALRRAGVTASTPDPPSATVARRHDAEPFGTLVEWTAMDLVKRFVPVPGPETKLAGLQASTALLAAAGVTWAQEAALAPDDVPVYLEAASGGLLSVRVNVALRAEPGQWRDQLPGFLAAREEAARSASADQVSARTVKFFADGIIEAGTGALLEPYLDAPDSCGLPVWAPAELAEAVVAFDRAGFQIHIHAIGDAGVRAALDAVELAGTANRPRDRRAVVAHTHLVHPDDVPRFADLGVIANFEPLWACLEPGMTSLVLPRIGAARSDLQYPMASVAAAGAMLSMGSDWPVSSMRPLEGLAVAVTRQTPDGLPPGGWTPHERLTADQALAAYSAGVAYQAFEDDRWGVVEPGFRADLVAVAQDPLGVDPLAWPSIEVTGTWLGGRRTFG